MFNKKKSGKNIVWVIILILLFILVIYGFYGYNSAKQVYNYANKANANLKTAQQAFLNRDFNRVTEQLVLAEKNFRKADKKLEILKYYRITPWISYQVRSAKKLFKIGIKMSSGLKDISLLGLKISNKANLSSDISYNDLTETQKKHILKFLNDSTDLFEKLIYNLHYSQRQLNTIDFNKLYKPLANKLEPGSNLIFEINKIAQRFQPFVRHIPYLLGYPEKRAYLLLLQNNNELRPTGGFIGTYGHIIIENASIKEFFIDNVYNLDSKADKFMSVSAPEPLQEYLDIKNWHLRDANWSPDFVVSAKKAEWFYHREKGKINKFDGVIAVDPIFFKNIMRLTGNITVDGVEFTPSNLADALENRVGKDFYSLGIAVDERKAIIEKLGEKLIQKLTKLPFKKWPLILDIMVGSLNEKHILIYFKNENLAKIMQERNWDGHIIQTNYDYFYVVDANLASLKTDQVIKRSVNYKVTKNNGNLLAELSIKYKNNGDFTWKTTRYRTYTRVYVPLGSELIKTTGLMANDRSNKKGRVEVYEEFNKTVFAGFISIEPKEKEVLTFKYKLPHNIVNDIKNNLYKLYIQKQPGTLANNLKLEFDFNKAISYIKPAYLTIETKDGSELKINTDLKVDRLIEIHLNK